MKGIILASHGKLAEGMLDTLQIFSGEQEQIQALGLMPGEELSDFLAKLTKAVEEVNTGDGVVIFCDLLFGSPCNCSARLLSDENYRDCIRVITGMNVCMVLEFVGARANGMEDSTLVQIGKDGIVDFAMMMASRNQ